MRAILPAALAGLMLAGCSFDKVNSGGNITFEGQTFRARLSADKEEYRQFEVVVEGVSKSLAGAREAGRYEATKYCIANFGKSDVEWSAGPDAPDAELVIVNDTLTFRGACKEW